MKTIQAVLFAVSVVVFGPSVNWMGSGSMQGVIVLFHGIMAAYLIMESLDL